VPLLNDNVVVPGIAVTLPPQVLPTNPGDAMDKPGCTPTKLSAQLAFVNWKVFGLKTVTRSTEVPPASINIGVNCLLISAGMAIAYAVSTGYMKSDPAKTNNRNRDLSDLNIIYILNLSV